MEHITIKEFVKNDGKMSYALPVKSGEIVFVIAPHPDDETIGCGGAILKMIRQHIDVRILLLTDGGNGVRPHEDAEVREREFERAMEVLGIKHIYRFGFKDGKLAESYILMRNELENYIKKDRPRLIFAPYIFDFNKDHQCAVKALIELRKIMISTDIMMYEVWTPILYPDYYINITEEYQNKKMAMQCYESQDIYYNIVEKAEALNRFRSTLSAYKKSSYMESFRRIHDN